MSAGSAGSPAATVSRLSVTAVKGTTLRTVQSVELESHGARGDRQFFVIDERDRMVNGKMLGALQTVVAEWDEDSRRLSMSFADGARVAGVVNAGPPVSARFFSRTQEGRLVQGPWAPAMSEHFGQPLRLVEAEGSVDRGAGGAVSLISRGSLDRLAREAGDDAIDARRFRMMIEVAGLAPHAEDEWVRRRAQIGGAVVRFGGHVGRCLITSRDPDSGEVDLPTLDLLRAYRSDTDTTEPLAFGIHGRVLEPGRIAVGDPVALLG